MRLSPGDSRFCPVDNEHQPTHISEKSAGPEFCDIGKFLVHFAAGLENVKICLWPLSFIRMSSGVLWALYPCRIWSPFSFIKFSRLADLKMCYIPWFLALFM